jgi:hypothetical protein
MTKLQNIVRWLLMLLCAAGAAYLFFVAYFGFLFAKAFRAQWLFANWSQNAGALFVGLFLILALWAFWRRKRGARLIAGLAFSTLLVWTVYDVVAYDSLTWMHILFGIFPILALIWVLSPASKIDLQDLRHKV